MDRLVIKLNNTPEVVNYLIIEELATASRNASVATLEGYLSVLKAYRDSVEYLVGAHLGLTINVVNNNYLIRFDDPNMKALCASYWGSDGELSTNEAAAVTSIPDTEFMNNTDITSFNELLYFGGSTGLRIGYSAFENCTNLMSVDLRNVTYLHNDVFRGCAKLTGIINIPRLTSLGTGVFRGTNITEVTNLGSITTLPSYKGVAAGIFLICRNLTTVNLPTTLTTISYETFEGCSNLTTITGLDNVTTIYDNAFHECSSLTSINLSSVTTMGDRAFKECFSLTSVDLSNSNLTRIPNECFDLCSNLTEIHLPITVTYLGLNWFKRTPSNATPIIVTGVDNVVNHHPNAWQFWSKNIQNPVCFNSTTESIIIAGDQPGDWSYTNAYFLPKMKKSMSGGGTFYEWVQLTAFTYRNMGNSSKTCRFGLLYFRDIEHFGIFTFFGTVITNLVINNVTPPDLIIEDDSGGTNMSQLWQTLLFPTAVGGAPSITTLWVPDSAVSTYQSNPLYSGLTIKGINTKTNGTDYDLPRYATYADWEAAAAVCRLNNTDVPVALIEEYM